MNQFYASDIALLKGEYKAAYITLMGNIMNSTESMETREEILSSVLSKLLYAQKLGFSAKSAIPKDYLHFYTNSVAQAKQNISPQKAETKRPPFPIFSLSLCVTISVIAYCLLFSKYFAKGQLIIFPEFIAVPATTVALFLIYYGFKVSKLYNNTKATAICMALAPIYLCIVAYLLLSKPLYFCSMLGMISLQIVIVLLAMLWVGTIVMTIVRRKRNKK